MTPPWIEAMRLRTLPVSVAGVVAGCAYAWHYESFAPLPAALCLLFAILAQIASNFANEYFDYKAGFDTSDRNGPRRGVSCGDISPQAMLRATLITLATACIIGCSLIWFGGWWLLPAGIVIALGALAYSAGPYPLSHHALGEVAVMIFFGIAPVNLTFYIQTHVFTTHVFLGSLAMGLLGAMVLMCNNYRDMDEDRKTGKHTLCTIIGRRATAWLYELSGIAAILLLGKQESLPIWILILVGMLILFRNKVNAKHCTQLLALTSLVMLASALLLFVAS